MDEAVDFMEREDTNKDNAAADQQQLGSKYLLGEQLGRGAMGVVYAGSTKDGEQVAVKILRPELSSDTKTVSRFIQERQIFSRVNHPNVVRVHDMVAEGDRLGIVMERVSSGDLKARIEAGTITPTQAVRISAAVADGLQAIHDVDVIHRDLKPANILLTTDADGRLMPKISDFGISRLVSEAMTRTSTTIGTPLYMAPESADQRGAGPASDVYALGAMLFEMLTGAPPFHQGGTFAVLRSHALDAPARVVGVPARLTDLIDAMLAKEPASRPSVQATRELLLNLLPEIEDTKQPSTVPVGPAAAAGIAAAGAAAAGISGEVANSSETIAAAVSNPGFDGPNDSSETIVASGASVGAAGNPNDSSETIVADLHAASTGPSASPSGPADSSETIVSSTMFGAAAAGAASGARAIPVAPVAPAPPAMPGQPAHLPGASTGGATLATAASTGGGAGGGTPIGTSDRAFDRVPRRVIEVGAVLASMAAVALIASFVLNGGDGGSSNVSADEAFVAGDALKPASADKNQEQANNDSGSGQSGFDNDANNDTGNDTGNGSTDTTAGSSSDDDDDSSTATTEKTTETTAGPGDDTTTTEKPTTTTEQPTTTVEEPTPTTEKPTPTTEKETTTTEEETTTTETSPPITIGPVFTPIAIVGGPTVNSRSATSFQFNYTTNNVCGSGSFTVVRASDGVRVGSYNGDGACYGPLHGGFPQAAGGSVFGNMNIEPNTTYTVNITLRGVNQSSGGPDLAAGEGTVRRSFNVTTTP